MGKKYGKVKKIVMIGDNEDTDILGAFNYGWQSILVRTGVSEGYQKQTKATHNCDNLIEGLSKYGVKSKKAE